jgi:hypothetical protein
VWLLLLGLRSEDLLAEDAATFALTARVAVRDENARDQIEKDVQRTRPGLARFKQPAVRGALLRLLSLFCERAGVSYIQGLNELLAPFVLLADTGGNPRIVYALFAEFITRFAPWMLDTSESRVFDILKRAFKYFGRLLLYHDPELFWLLENNMMTPDLYATSWFVTLYARNFTVETVLALWDLLLLEDNPLGTCFFGLALLISKRDQLLAIDPSRLPETLMMLRANTPDEVRVLWKVANTLRAVHTPPSFQRLMSDRLHLTQGSPAQKALSAARSMQASVCLQTTSDDLTAGDVHYFTWDCRTQAEFDAGHLAHAAYLCLDELRDAGGIRDHPSDPLRAELERAVSLCEPLRGASHICLVGTGLKADDDEDVNVFALYLTSLGIPYVSTLRGGFQAAVAAARADDVLSTVELVDYNPAACAAAAAKRISDRKTRLARRARREQEARAEAEARLKIEAAMRAIANDEETDEAAEASGGIPSRAAGIAEGGRAHSSSQILQGPNEGVRSPARGTFNNHSVRTSGTDGDAQGFGGINRVLNGIGLKLAGLTSPFDAASTPDSHFSSVSHPFSAAAEAAGPPRDASVLANLDSVITNSSGSEGSSSTATPQSSDLPQIRRSLSSSAGVGSSMRGLDPSTGVSSAENSPRTIEAPATSMSPRPGVQPGDQGEPSTPSSSGSLRQKGPSKATVGFFGKSPWGREAKPGWLSDESLVYPLSAMLKGFTVNVMDDRVMAGLRLFPCRARSDNSGVRGMTTGEFKRRYVGVSANYFMLLSPHGSRSHILEVKLIRLLQDIVRITFKRSRPELVTFEILGGVNNQLPNEQIVCIMPDGLTECVELIKDYLDQNEEEVDSGDRADQKDVTPHPHKPPKSAPLPARNAEDRTSRGITEGVTLIDVDDMSDLPTPVTLSNSAALPSKHQLRRGMESRAGNVGPNFPDARGSSEDIPSRLPRHVHSGIEDFVPQATVAAISLSDTNLDPGDSSEFTWIESPNHSND